MALKGSIRSTQPFSNPDTSLEIEEETDYNYNYNFDYLYSSDAGAVFLDSFGNGKGTGNSSLKRLLSIVSSGTGNGSGSGEINTGLFIAASGAGSGTGTSAILEVFIPLIGTGTGNLTTTSDFLIIKSLVGSSSGNLTGSGNISAILRLDGNGQGTGNGTFKIVILGSISASGSGTGVGSTSVKNVLSLRASSLGEGIGGTGDAPARLFDSNFSIGDTYVPLVTEKDISIDKDTDMKEFVGKTASASDDAFDIDSQYERGTYTVVLNQEAHPGSLSLSNQKDELEALTDSDPSNNQIAAPGGETIYAAVENVNIENIGGEQEVRRGSIDLILLEEV